MAARRDRCAVCGQEAYRNKYGRMMLHTIQVVSDQIGSKVVPEICSGSDLGARP